MRTRLVQLFTLCSTNLWVCAAQLQRLLLESFTEKRHFQQFHWRHKFSSIQQEFFLSRSDLVTYSFMSPHLMWIKDFRRRKSGWAFCISSRHVEDVKIGGLRGWWVPSYWLIKLNDLNHTRSTVWNVGVTFYSPCWIKSPFNDDRY